MADEWMTVEIAPVPEYLLPPVDEPKRGRPRKDDPYRRKYSLSEVREMLARIPADNRDLWRAVFIIMGREYKRSDEAWAIANDWAAKWDGPKGRGHDEIMHQAFYDLSQESSERELSMGTIVKAAIDNGWVPTKGQVPKEKFVYYTSGNNFIYRPTGSEWIASAVDVAVRPVNVEGKLVKASVWIQAHQLVTSITCDPALEDDYVKGFDCRNGERIESEGAALFNTYRKPTLELGDAGLAGPWRDHVCRVMDKAGDAEQFLNYMAHRVQCPGEKPRFALLIAGGQGIGKDTAIEMCVPAIGAWNVANVDPGVFDTAYNDYVCSTLVRISETSNLHEMSKWAFNERTKVLIAGTPDVCRVNPKYGEQFSIRMYCGVILTTNNLAAGIYIPQDDRRYDVIECASMEEMKLSEESARRAYFSDLWDWFLADGAKHIAAFLHERDLSKFSASNGQRKTAAHQEVVAVNLEADQWLDDILFSLEEPLWVRGEVIVKWAVNNGEKDMEVRRKFTPSMKRAGYVKYPNPDRKKDGRWKDPVHITLVTIWRKKDTPPLSEEQFKALLRGESSESRGWARQLF